MKQKKLNINLEGLWNNPDHLFTVRYKNIDEEYKTILAQRIKTLAKQKNIKKATGPTIEIIKETLEEINPIIFSEEFRRRGWIGSLTENHKRFGTNNAYYTAGYRFEMLCQAIYLINCKKTPPKPHELHQIARLTHPDWIITEEYITERLNIQENEEERITPIEDFGMENIETARIMAQQNMNNNIDLARTFTPDIEYDQIRTNTIENNFEDINEI